MLNKLKKLNGKPLCLLAILPLFIASCSSGIAASNSLPQPVVEEKSFNTPSDQELYSVVKPAFNDFRFWANFSVEKNTPTVDVVKDNSGVENDKGSESPRVEDSVRPSQEIQENVVDDVSPAVNNFVDDKPAVKVVEEKVVEEKPSEPVSEHKTIVLNPEYECSVTRYSTDCRTAEQLQNIIDTHNEVTLNVPFGAYVSGHVHLTMNKILGAKVGDSVVINGSSMDGNWVVTGTGKTPRKGVKTSDLYGYMMMTCFWDKDDPDNMFVAYLERV